MDFIFQDDGADIIRRELMAPRPAIVQSLIQAEPSKRYVKMAQICISTIDKKRQPDNAPLISAMEIRPSINILKVILTP